MTDDAEALLRAYHHLHVLFGEISVQVLRLFSNWIFVSLLLSLESCYTV